MNITKQNMHLYNLSQDKQKHITHLEMRRRCSTPFNANTKSNGNAAAAPYSVDIYLEVESQHYGDWNNLGTLMETLAAIDIHTQQTVQAPTDQHKVEGGGGQGEQEIKRQEEQREGEAGSQEGTRLHTTTVGTILIFSSN